MADFDYTRELDKIKASVFLGNNAAFFGSLMSSMKFEWMDTGTAETDGETIWICREFFRNASVNLRKFMLVHELWHVARLHMIRQGSRIFKIWVQACDLRINKDMVDEGFSFDGFTPWYDPSIGTKSEEEIYDDLIAGLILIPQTDWLGQPGDTGDILENPVKAISPQSIVNRVVHATQQAKIMGAGQGISNIQKVLDEFLEPVVPWQTVLFDFFTDLDQTESSWNRPNRRFPDMYLPYQKPSENRLEHLAYYFDVSWSVSDEDVVRFNSEVKYIKDTFCPQLLSLVQFADGIVQETQFDEFTPFDKIHIAGRGGTNLEPVRQHIIKTEPTAAIIFSDLDCYPIGELPKHIPVIWIVVGKNQAFKPSGIVVHI